MLPDDVGKQSSWIELNWIWSIELHDPTSGDE